MKHNRIIQIILVMLLMLSVEIPVLAEDINQDEGGGYVSSEYLTWMMSLEGQNSTEALSSKSLGVSRLAQNDYGGNIPSQGCALCGFTMIYNYFKDTSISPVTMVTSILGRSIYNVGMAWYSDASAAGLNLMADRVNTSNTGVVSICISNINADRPVLVQLRKPKTTNSSGEVTEWSYHYVVAYGYVMAATTTIRICDPGSVNHTTLASAISSGWTVNKYSVFSNAS